MTDVPRNQIPTTVPIFLVYRREVTEADKATLCEVLDTHLDNVKPCRNPRYLDCFQVPVDGLGRKIEALWSLAEICDLRMTR